MVCRLAALNKGGGSMAEREGAFGNVKSWGSVGDGLGCGVGCLHLQIKMSQKYTNVDWQAAAQHKHTIADM